MAVMHELLHGGRDEADAILVILDLFGYTDTHDWISLDWFVGLLCAAVAAALPVRQYDRNIVQLFAYFSFLIVRLSNLVAEIAIFLEFYAYFKSIARRA
jgi:hypothetical protein